MQRAIGSSPWLNWICRADVAMYAQKKHRPPFNMAAAKAAQRWVLEG